MCNVAFWNSKGFITATNEYWNERWINSEGIHLILDYNSIKKFTNIISHEIQQKTTVEINIWIWEERASHFIRWDNMVRQSPKCSNIDKIEGIISFFFKFMTNNGTIVQYNSLLNKIRHIQVYTYFCI